MIDADKLVGKRQVDTTVLVIEGKGEIEVRALTRKESLDLREADSVAESERKILAAALVDPVLTLDQIEEWQNNSPAGELEAITKYIARMSGMDEEADNRMVRRFSEDPDPAA